jgi:lysophospholipase L1-like esterase
VAKKLLILLILGGLIVVSALLAYRYIKHHQTPVPLATRVPAKDHPNFLFVLVGDSMTEALGNADELAANISGYYPGKTLDILNYGYGSTNILSVPDRLTQWTNHNRQYQPILDIDSSMIILESMGNNPLSDYPLSEGLKKQTETLDQIVKLIHDKRPQTKLVFMATLAPNKQIYGQGAFDLSPTQRAQWVSDRDAYIKNHMSYAKSHNIPLIDVFDDSKDQNGDGKPEYFDDATHIHPSPKGIIFISHEIADFIYKNHLI